MLENIRQILLLMRKSHKVWLLPVFLSLMILIVLIVGAHVAPVPLFIYPLV